VSSPNEQGESQAIWRFEEGHLIGQGNLVPLYCLTAPRVPSLDVRQNCIPKCWTKGAGSANPLDVWCHVRRSGKTDRSLPNAFWVFYAEKQGVNITQYLSSSFWLDQKLASEENINDGIHPF
jgi:hypothetical protein